MNDMMVTIVVVTYNQEKWIRENLLSLVNQETEFQYEVIIGEDHGTDGTRAICQEFANKYENIRILSAHDKNIGSVPNWVECVMAGSGKYIMCCDGDDYWHNPNKLQIQVEYMESHPECVALHTNIDVFHENTGRLEKSIKNGKEIPQGMIQKEILEGKHNVSTVSLCLRRDMFEQKVPFNKFSELNIPCIDWSALLVLSAYGEVHYLPVSTATYRVGQESVSHERNYESIKDHCKRDKAMVQYLYSLFPEFGPLDEKYYDERVYFFLLRAAYDNNDFKSACKYARLCPVKDKYQKMAKNSIMFQLARIYIKYWKK